MLLMSSARSVDVDCFRLPSVGQEAPQTPRAGPAAAAAVEDDGGEDALTDTETANCWYSVLGTSGQVSPRHTHTVDFIPCHRKLRRRRHADYFYIGSSSR